MRMAQIRTKPIQCQMLVKRWKGISEKPKVMVAMPIPRARTMEGINHFMDIFKVPAIITSASSGKMGKSIIRGK